MDNVRSAGYWDYRTWDGSPWRAWRHKNEFFHAPEGDETRKRDKPDTIINYMSWPDLLQMTAKWDGNGFLVRVRNQGDWVASQELDYIGWASAPHVEGWRVSWNAADRPEPKFKHVRIARAAPFPGILSPEPVPSARTLAGSS